MDLQEINTTNQCCVVQTARKFHGVADTCSPHDNQMCRLRNYPGRHTLFGTGYQEVSTTRSTDSKKLPSVADTCSPHDIVLLKCR